MNNDRKIESGQLWKDKLLDAEELMFVVRVSEDFVVVRYLDSWDNYESNYTYDKGWFLSRSILIM